MRQTQAEDRSTSAAGIFRDITGFAHTFGAADR